MQQPHFNPARVADFIKNFSKILVVTHTNPDGDALGSLSAVAQLCDSLGKNVRVLCASAIPEQLDWVALPHKPARYVADLAPWRPELLITLDCGDSHRAGAEIQAYFDGNRPRGWSHVKSLNIDHHLGNPEFADCNWVEPTAGATAELVGLLAEYLGLPLAGTLGEGVYLGIVSDTGNFSYSNTSPEILDMASRVIRAGLHVESFNEKRNNNWSSGRMKLWGELLQNIRLYAEGRVVSTLIYGDTLKKHDCTASDLEGLVSFIRQLKGVDVSMLVREKPSFGSKVSLRSKGGENSVDVQLIAAHFGGGGHKAASGIELALKPEEAEKAVLELLLPVLGTVSK